MRRRRVTLELPETLLQAARKYALDLAKPLAELDVILRRELVGHPDLRQDIGSLGRLLASIAAQRKLYNDRINSVAARARLEGLFERVDLASVEAHMRRLGILGESAESRARALARFKEARKVELAFVPDDALAERWREQNEKLGKDLGRGYYDDVEAVLREAPVGISYGEISERLQERLGVASSRADLIAVDQTLKLNADINEARQKDLGITRYVWRTAGGDERVREWHQALDGQEFSWGDPPLGGGTGPEDVGHPGSGIRCRCYAEGIISDEELGLYT